MMRLYVTVNPDIKEETVQMNVRKISEKVEQIRKIVENGNPRDYISVLKEERSYIIPLEQISHLVSENGKNFAVSGKEKFQYRETLNYFEEMQVNGILCVSPNTAWRILTGWIISRRGSAAI